MSTLVPGVKQPAQTTSAVQYDSKRGLQFQARSALTSGVQVGTPQQQQPAPTLVGLDYTTVTSPSQSSSGSGVLTVTQTLFFSNLPLPISTGQGSQLFFEIGAQEIGVIDTSASGFSMVHFKISPFGYLTGTNAPLPAIPDLPAGTYMRFGATVAIDVLCPTGSTTFEVIASLVARLYAVAA